MEERKTSGEEDRKGLRTRGVKKGEVRRTVVEERRGGEDERVRGRVGEEEEIRRGGVVKRGEEASWSGGEQRGEKVRTDGEEQSMSRGGEIREREKERGRG